MNEIDELYARIKDLSSELLEEEKIRANVERQLAAARAELADFRSTIVQVLELSEGGYHKSAEEMLRFMLADSKEPHP